MHPSGMGSGLNLRTVRRCFTRFNRRSYSSCGIGGSSISNSGPVFDRAVGSSANYIRSGRRLRKVIYAIQNRLPYAHVKNSYAGLNLGRVLHAVIRFDPQQGRTVAGALGAALIPADKFCELVMLPGQCPVAASLLNSLRRHR